MAALGTAMFRGFQDAAALQTMMAKTNAVVASTSGAANVSAASVVKMSDKLEAMSMIDQEAILQGQNLLLTFTNLRNGVGASNHIFDQATLAMVNVAAAMGKDPQSAATMLGKALNDPLKGLTALGKAGVQFSAQQKKQIQTFVATGKTMDAQKVILKELEVQFGGAAKAAGSGFEGAMFRAKDAVGDLFRDLATPLLPRVTAWAEGFASKMPAVTRALSDFASGAMPGIKDGLRSFADSMSNIADRARGVLDLDGKARGTGEAIGKLAGGLIGFAGKAAEVWVTVQAGLAKFLRASLDAIRDVTGTMAVTFANLSSLPGEMGRSFGAIALGLSKVSTATYEAGRAVDSLLAPRTATFSVAYGSARAAGAAPGVARAEAAEARSQVTAPAARPRPVPAPTAPTRPNPPAGNLRTTLVIPLQVDGREMTRVVIDDLETRMARR